MQNLRALTREEVRLVDQRAINDLGMPGVVLMENAGRNAAHLLLELGISGPVVICAGKGNNGGDGLVIARHLQNAGVAVQVLLFAEPEDLQGDARINFGIIREFVPWQVCTVDQPAWMSLLECADWIVDALLGTGTRGAIREPYVTAIQAINASPARVLAVDLPAGLDCDTGEPLNACVRADVTATFVAAKTGFAQLAAQSCLGMLRVLDIGVPQHWLSQLFAEQKPG